jgi:glutamate---cysteine ligase / carboxylate-amine ligase
VELSTHPTLVGGRIEPRHADLRVFATVRPGEGTGRPKATALPAPLTRMAPAGSLVVNTSRGGGDKDAWIVG